MIRGGCGVDFDQSPCPDRPVSSDISITRPGSATIVARIRSGVDGRFRVALSPGRYVLWMVSSTGAGRRGEPFDVDVEVGRYSSVTLRMDSGFQFPPGPGG